MLSMYSKIKVPGGREFVSKVKQMSIEELLALSLELRQQSQELSEEMQVIHENLLAKRIERVTERLNRLDEQGQSH